MQRRNQLKKMNQDEAGLKVRKYQKTEDLQQCQCRDVSAGFSEYRAPAFLVRGGLGIGSVDAKQLSSGICGSIGKNC